jgi:type I restriction enzyme S subunit
VKVERISLGEVCDFLYGDGLVEAQRKEGKVPVYGSNGIVGHHNQAITQGPTLVIGRKGSIGEVHLSPVPCWPIDTTYYVDAAKRPCDLTWLYYTLIALDLTHLNKSAAVPGLNREDAYRAQILFPPLPEQQRIAAILAKADRLRRQRRYALELSAGYLQAVFHSLFKDATYQYMEFDDLAIKQRGAFVNGPFGSNLLTTELVSTGVPVIYIRDIRDGYYLRESDVCVTEEKAEELDVCRVDPGDVLIAKVGDPPGTSAVYPNDQPSGIVTQDVIRMKVNRHLVTPEYIAHFLNSEKGHHFLKPIIIEATRERFGLTSLKQLAAPVPPLHLQEQYTQIVKKYDRLRAQQQEGLRQAEHLFQTLLARAFRGELETRG